MAYWVRDLECDMGCTFDTTADEGQELVTCPACSTEVELVTGWRDNLPTGLCAWCHDPLDTYRHQRTAMGFICRDRR